MIEIEVMVKSVNKLWFPKVSGDIPNECILDEHLNCEDCILQEDNYNDAYEQYK